MSRLVSLLIVLLAIAVFAAPAIAEDRLGLSGQMRVLFNHVDDDGDNTTNYVSQRLRLGGKFSIAEGVSVSFRTDITEADWGSDDGTGLSIGAGRAGADHWDRAHLDLDFGGTALRAGLQLILFGKTAVVDSQDNGFRFDFKGAIPVTLFWQLVDNNGSATTNSDDYLYGANIGHKTDAYASNVILAGQKGDDEDVYVIGVNADFFLEALTLTAEIDYFTGDASSTMDAAGLQGMLDAAFAMSEALTVGGQFFYAADTDSDEVQYVALGNGFNGWDPLNEIGTGLGNVKETFGNVYNALGSGAGIMALRGYTTAKLSDTTTVGASIAYMEAVEEDNTMTEDGMHFAVGVDYKLLANTAVRAQIAYEDLDNMDEELNVHTGLIVNF